jgi:hypothetical protein
MNERNLVGRRNHRLHSKQSLTPKESMEGFFKNYNY